MATQKDFASKGRGRHKRSQVREEDTMTAKIDALNGLFAKRTYRRTQMKTKKGWLRISVYGMLLFAVIAAVLAAPAQALAAGSQNPLALRAWLGEYFDNRSLDGAPERVSDDAAIDFDWGYGAPRGLPGDGFSARWTRSLHFDAGTYRFYALADDGVRVWLDGELIIDQWHPSPGNTYAADRALAAGNHILRVEYYEESGGAKVHFWWDTLISAYYPDWRGEYYANASLDGSPALVRNDKAIDFNWGGLSPISGVDGDTYSVRWTRELNFDAGVYRFYVTLYGDVVVWIDEELVLDARGYGANRSFSSDYILRRGKHEVKVEFFNSGGNGRIEFSWELYDAHPESEWLGEYYNNRYLHGDPVLVRYDEAPVFDWGRGAAAESLPEDGFSVRWTHREHFAGVYEFYAEATDGIRVYVEGELVIDEWPQGEGSVDSVVTVRLDGKKEVVVEYFNRRGDAQVQFYWVRVSE
jgi:hypothetical protein